MRAIKTFYFAFICLITLQVSAQTNFSLENYKSFMDANKNLRASELLERHAPVNDYYYTAQTATPLGQYQFLDSIVEKYELTQGELMMLSENRFVVTERLSFNKMAVGFDDVWMNDLPVFVSTDAILHAFHISYANILKDVEEGVLYPQIYEMVEKLYHIYPTIIQANCQLEEMHDALNDLDVYLTVALNLLDNNDWPTQRDNQNKIDEVLAAISAEEYTEMSLFTDIIRRLDFSQFKTRGHYQDSEILERYFKCMMWFGRMEFILANAPEEWYSSGFNEEGLKRMNLTALLFSDLVNMSSLMDEIDDVNLTLELFVGESDNVRLKEIIKVEETIGIEKASD